MKILKPLVTDVAFIALGNVANLILCLIVLMEKWAKILIMLYAVFIVEKLPLQVYNKC